MVVPLELEKCPRMPMEEEMAPPVKPEFHYQPPPCRRRFSLLHCTILCSIMLLYATLDLAGNRSAGHDGFFSCNLEANDRFEKLFLCAISLFHFQHQTIINYHPVPYLIPKLH
jgi:hypothetical protein